MHARMFMLLTREAGPMAVWMLSVPIAVLAFFLRVFTLLGDARVFDTGSHFEAGVSDRKIKSGARPGAFITRLWNKVPPPLRLKPDSMATG